MKSLEVRFAIEMETPCVSTFIAFVRAVKGGRYARKIVVRWFNRLVDKDDYASRDKIKLIDWLCMLTNKEST